MVYCNKCGKELPEGTKYCPGCGSAVDAPSYYGQGAPQYEKEESGVVAWGLLSFVLALFTVVGGLILCLVLYGSGKPRSGRAALIGGVLIPIIFTIIGLVIFFVIIGAAASQDSFIGLF